VTTATVEGALDDEVAGDDELVGGLVEDLEELGR
jgi:hypothetical protein